jgi:hypothetical protein
LADRKKLTQSGEFLSDCLGSIKSEEGTSNKSDDELEGEIIRGNANCQVHVQSDISKDSDNQSSDGDVTAPLMNAEDRSSCEEAPCQRIDREENQSQYAELQKAEKLAEQAHVDKAINEAVKEIDHDEDDAVEDELEPMIRKKSGALPAIDTSRASQVLCSAPSTMSPRESNVVFLYVNPGKEEI